MKFSDKEKIAEAMADVQDNIYILIDHFEKNYITMEEFKENLIKNCANKIGKAKDYLWLCDENEK